jgi:hypothetical protein
VGGGPDPAAIHQRQVADREAGIHRHAVRAVAVDHERRRAIDGRVTASQDGDGHLLAVRRRGEQAAGHIVLGVVARGDLLGLAQHLLARGHVVVEGLGRGGGRGVDVAQGGGVELVAALDAQHIGFLRLDDLVFAQVVLAGDDQAGVGVDPLAADQVVLERRGLHHIGARAVRLPLGPVGGGGIVLGRPHQLEVDGAVRIGQDHETVAPVLQLIAHAHAARLHHARLGRGVRRGDQAVFAGLLVLAGDADVGAGPAGPHADEHAGVGFLIDQHILAAACGATVDLRRSPVLVAEGPEQPLGVGREGEVAGGALDRSRQNLARGQILDLDDVIFRALRILSPGVQGMVRAVLRAAHVIVVVGLGQGVHVDQDLLAVLASARPTGVQRMLGPDLVPGVVFPVAVGGGDRAVVLLDAALHLLEQGVLEVFGGGQHGAGIGVLGVQMLADVGAQHRRVAHDRLPVVVLHPEVVVGPGAAQLGDAVGVTAGDGRLGHRNSGLLAGPDRAARGGEGRRGGDGHDHLTAVHPRFPELDSPIGAATLCLTSSGRQMPMRIIEESSCSPKP